MFELRGALATFYRCTDPEILIEGRAGTGKTQGILAKRLRDCAQYPGSRHLVCRSTRKSMTESTLVTIEKLLPNHPEVFRVSRENRESYRLGAGELVVCGLDNMEKTLSTEYDTVYVGEATEITLDQWEMLARPLRNFRMPYQQRVADCNPGPPRHWLNQRATPASDELRRVRTHAEYVRLQQFNHYQRADKMRRLISVHQDNPAYFDHRPEVWQWHEAGRRYIEGTLNSLSGHRRERLLDGRWVSAEGTVYPEFSEGRHSVLPFKVPASWPIYVGCDPGYDHPCAILWFAVAPNGCVYIIDELYRGGVSIEQHAKDINARNAGRTVRGYYADPQHAFSSTAQSPETIAAQFLKHGGIRFTPWPRTGKNEETMVEAVRELLRSDRLKVFAPCQNTIGEFQSWRYARDAKGNPKPGEDRFEDANNNAMDVVKGVVATKPSSTGPRVILGGTQAA